MKSFSREKILKYELLGLFLLALNSWMLFGLKAKLSDDYLHISSSNSLSFFSYYLLSFFSMINYYTGPWFLLLFGLMAIAQVLY